MDAEAIPVAPAFSATARCAAYAPQAGRTPLRTLRNHKLECLGCANPRKISRLIRQAGGRPRFAAERGQPLVLG
jgi:hypothetical protein